MKFSEDYNRILRISKSFKSEKDIENHLSKWSSSVVNTLYDFFKNEGYHFKVVITLDPNPSECKGTDTAKIEVWQTESQGVPGFRPFIKMMSNSHHTLSECIQDLNEKVDILTHKETPQIVEINGKKYQLTEVIE